MSEPTTNRWCTTDRCQLDEHPGDNRHMDFTGTVFTVDDEGNTEILSTYHDPEVD